MMNTDMFQRGLKDLEKHCTTQKIKVAMKEQGKNLEDFDQSRYKTLLSHIITGCNIINKTMKFIYFFI